MHKNVLLDTSLTGSPFHTLRAFLWNLRTLGPSTWLRCCLHNMACATLEAVSRIAFAIAGPALSETGKSDVTLARATAPGWLERQTLR